MRNEVKVINLKDGWFKVEDQWGICHMQGEDKAQCEEYVEKVNSCVHDTNITVGFNPANSEVEITCDVCESETSFPLPDGMEWM